METLDFCSSLIPRFLFATTISLDAALIKVSVDTVELGLKVQASAEDSFCFFMLVTLLMSHST